MTAPGPGSRRRPSALVVWSLLVGTVAALVAVTSFLGLLAVGASASGGYDYGIPELLLTLAAVCAAVAAVHLAFVTLTRSAGEGGDRRSLLAATLAVPVLVAAALLSGFVSVDWPVLLLGLAATFVPHAVGLLRRVRRGAGRGIPSQV